MSESKQQPIQPTASIAAPALRKRFYEAHRFLSRVAQFPLVLAKLYRDGLEHPKFFHTMNELLSCDRLSFCLWQNQIVDGQVETQTWSWTSKGGALQEHEDTMSVSFLQTLRTKPLRFNDASQECEPDFLQQGEVFWGGELRSVLVLPLLFQGKSLGVMVFATSQAARYNDGDFAHAQFLADALTPLVAYRLLEHSQSTSQQEKLQTLELENESQGQKVAAYEQQLSDQSKELADAKARLEALEQERYKLQKRIQVMQMERESAGKRYEAIRAQRNELRALGEQFEQQARAAMERGEMQRQQLLHVHRSASMMRRLAEERIKNGLSNSQDQTELILDASSQMIPEALNSLNHLNSLQDPSFGQLNNRQQRFVRFSLRSIQYISQLLSELNDYNRCLLGKLQINPEEVQLEPLLDEVRAKFSHHIKQKRINAEFAVMLPSIEADAYICRQIFHALLEHTVDATPISGSIQCDIVPHPDDDGLMMLVLEHETELELLREGQLDSLFVPFQRPDFDPDDDIPPGLALPLARELTLFHNGDLRVEQKGQSLRFEIELPRRIEKRGLNEAPQSAFTPLIELPPLAEEAQRPFAESFALPSIPSPMVSSDLFPAATGSQSYLPSASQSNLPQPPRSLSSPSIPALPPLPPDALDVIREHQEREEAPQDAFVSGDSPTPGLSQPRLEPLPRRSVSQPRMNALPDDEAATMLAPPESGITTSLANAETLGTGDMPYFSAPDDSLEAELDLEDHSPTQIAFLADGIKQPSPAPNVFEVDSEEGDLFVLEELDEGSDDFEDFEDFEEVEEVEDEYVIEELEEPEFLSPALVPPKLSSSEQPQMVFLSDQPGSSPPSLFALLDAWGYELSEAKSDEELLQALNSARAQLLSLVVTQGEGMIKSTLPKLQRVLMRKGLPLMLFQQGNQRETKVQFRWMGRSSAPLKESFWLGWLDRIRHPRTEGHREVLSIGLDMKQHDPSVLLRFFCGTEYNLRTENNPALGVQRLYEAPPDLLLIQLDDPMDHWVPLFEEVGRSGRTREIPILVLSEQSLSANLERALLHLHSLHLS